jgi:hypothetical protein
VDAAIRFVEAMRICQVWRQIIVCGTCQTRLIEPIRLVLRAPETQMSLVVAKATATDPGREFHSAAEW